MAEKFLIRTEGGPCDGETRVVGPDGPVTYSWPLPEVLPYDETGHYVKVSESSLPPMDLSKHVMRGARYEWRPNGRE